MDISEESYAAHKRTFLDFLNIDQGAGIYMDAIKGMITNKQRRCLIVDLSDLHDYNSDLARRLLRSPSEYIQPFCDAVTEVTWGIDIKFLKEGEQVAVGFEGPFVSRRVTP